MEKIPILGVIVGKGQVKMEQEKINAVKKIEDANKDQGHKEFPQIRKLLSMLYPELQLYSKTIKWQPVERNYEIYNKELLAIVKALTKQRQYLLDTMKPFEVWTDYKNLKYF